MCPNGYYSLEQRDESCKICPDNAKCFHNGSFIELLPGYWRSGYYSTKIYKCESDYACLGADLCEKGYEGPLCDTCINKLNYQFYKTFDLMCIRCEEAIISYVFFGLV